MGGKHRLCSCETTGTTVAKILLDMVRVQCTVSVEIL